MRSQRTTVGYHAQSPFISPLAKPSPSKPPPGSQSLCSHAGQTCRKQSQNYWHYCGDGNSLALTNFKSCPNNISMLALLSNAVTLAAGLACEGMPDGGNILYLHNALRSDNSRRLYPKLACLLLHGQSWYCRCRWPHPSGMYDIAYLRCLPNMVLMAPKDEELQQMVVTGVHTDGSTR